MVGGHYTYGGRSWWATLSLTRSASPATHALLVRLSARFFCCFAARPAGSCSWPCAAPFAISAAYECIEWWTALVGGENADAFLGTRSVDTQWDMFMALVGAVASVTLLGRVHDRQITQLTRTPDGRHKVLDPLGPARLWGELSQGPLLPRAHVDLHGGGHRPRPCSWWCRSLFSNPGPCGSRGGLRGVDCELPHATLYVAMHAGFVVERYAATTVGVMRKNQRGWRRSRCTGGSSMVEPSAWLAEVDDLHHLAHENASRPTPGEDADHGGPPAA